MKTIGKLLGGTAFAAGVLIFVPVTTQAQNLLTDPSFEAQTTAPNPNPSGLPGWSLFNGAGFSTAEALTGTHSLIEAGGGGFSVPGAFQQFNTGPGVAWTMTGNVLGTTAPGAGTTFSILQLTFFSGPNGTGSNLGTVETSPGNALGSAAQLNASSPLNTWIPLSVTAHGPAGTESVQAFAITIDQNPITGYFDDMTLTAAPEPSTLALLGLSAAGIPFLLRRKKK